MPWVVNQLSNRALSWFTLVGGDEVSSRALLAFQALSPTLSAIPRGPLVHGSIHYKECDWRTCRVRRGHLHLPCSCPGDLVTSGKSLTHPDFYFKWAIIELLKYVFIPSHWGIRAMDLIGPFFFHCTLISIGKAATKIKALLLLFQLSYLEMIILMEPSDIEQKILLSPLGDNCLLAIIPITAFPYYCYKSL